MTITLKDFDFNLDTNVNNWTTIKSQSYSPDRDTALLVAFRKSFTEIKIDTAQDVLKLVGRSKTLSKWYANFNLEFLTDEKIPEGFRNIGDKKSMIKAQSNIQKFNKIIVDEQNEKFKAQKEFNDKIAKIEEKYENEKNLLLEDKILYILTLNKTELPLTILQKIENYTPSNIDDHLESKKYANEMLYLYKKQLLEHISIDENKNVDIKKIVTDLSSK